jgi:hypothetical protein
MGNNEVITRAIIVVLRVKREARIGGAFGVGGIGGIVDQGL